MRQSEKLNQWCLGMKVHVDTDATRGLVLTSGLTASSVHDAKVTDNLIREDDRAGYGYMGYASEKGKRAARRAGVLKAVKEKCKARTETRCVASREEHAIWQDTRKRRARVPRSSVPTRISKSTLLGDQKERRIGLLAPCSRQHLPRSADANGGDHERQLPAEPSTIALSTNQTRKDPLSIERSIRPSLNSDPNSIESYQSGLQRQVE